MGKFKAKQWQGHIQISTETFMCALSQNNDYFCCLSAQKEWKNMKKKYELLSKSEFYKDAF